MKKIAVNAPMLRHANRSSIMRHVRERGDLSRAMLAREIQLSKPAVSSLVDDLISEGWLIETGEGDSTGGRKPTMLRINPNAGGIIGVIYNSYGLDMILVDFSGKTKFEAFSSMDDDLNGVELLDEVCCSINAFIDANKYRVSRILGVGMGLPGAVKQNDGSVLFTPVKGWQQLNIGEELIRRINHPVILENDSNLMALGEHNAGAGKGANDMVYINVGSGIGAGIIIDGRIFRGFRETAGEIGYFRFGNAKNASLGHGGIFEGNYSARTIRKRFYADKKLRLLLGDSPVDNSGFMQQLRSLAENSDAARNFWEDVLRNWSYAVSAIASLLSPQLIVLGGEMPIAGREGMRFIQREVESILSFPIELRNAVLGRKAGLLGAAHLVLDSDRALLNIGK